MRLTAALLTALLFAAHAAWADWHNAVKVIADGRFRVATPAGNGEVPIYVSADWSHPLPGIRRVVIVMHGIGRDADAYMRTGLAARDTAGGEGQASLLIAPQFLADVDVTTWRLPATVLHWDAGNWAAGEPAHGPAPLSTFDVFDALLMHLADRTVLPDLTTVVIAGHSAGGQVVQRYAVVGRGGVALLARGIHLRYVVANPSSYLYLSPDRPEKVDAASCPLLNRWRYGLEAAPPYVGATAGLETRYAARDVVYLLGTADVDPRHPDLETGCAAEAEGAYRLVRGTNYFAYMKARHPQGLVQRMAFVPNVAHSGGRMFRSVCGLAALFDRPGCSGL